MSAPKYTPKNHKFKKKFVQKKNTNLPVLPIPLSRKAQNINDLIKDNRNNVKASMAWLITINNPIKKNLSPERIKELMKRRTSIIYWCMADETAKTDTPHTHLFLRGSTKIRISTLKRLFGNVHYDVAKGTCEENRDYIFKQGEKWGNHEKADTNNRDSHYQWGEMPDEKQDTKLNKLVILRMAEEGLTALQIVRTLNKYEYGLKNIEYIVDSYHKDKYSNEDRELDVTFVVTRNITDMTKTIKRCCGKGAVFRARSENNCFDEYKYQDVLLFENFDDNHFDIDKMNLYLDGQSGIFLPARINNRPSCYKRVFITSRQGLEYMYLSAKADARRELFGKIHNVWVQVEDGVIKYTLNEYLANMPQSLTHMDYGANEKFILKTNCTTTN